MRSLPIPLISLALIAVIAAVVAYFSGLPFWLTFVLAAVAIFANGLLATVEDDLPGGFNNPDGTDTPRYVRYIRIAAWTVAIVLGLLIALSLCLRLL